MTPPSGGPRLAPLRMEEDAPGTAAPLSVILVVIDTLRYDFVGANGNPWVHTPTLDGLARRGVTFDRCYAGSFPTIPCRWELLTGRAHPEGLPFHPWRPLEWGVPTVPDALREAGYVTALLCDTPHLINHGYGFDRPFHAWDLIRGQEVDRISTEPLTAADLPPPEARHWRGAPPPEGPPPAPTWPRPTPRTRPCGACRSPTASTCATGASGARRRRRTTCRPGSSPPPPAGWSATATIPGSSSGWTASTPTSRGTRRRPTGGATTRRPAG